MISKTLVVAAAVTALAAGAAHAGDKDKKKAAEAAPASTLTDMSQDMSPENRAAASPPSVYADPGMAADASSTTAMSATSTSTDASAVVSTQLVTNGPVPDTAENRAKYGPPMSRAGKRTAPTGN
jgi:hypothetical protein